MRVFRHNLSGGVLGVDLHHRSEMEIYHKGNLVQESFLPTPYGGIMRRPPSEFLLEHDSVQVDSVVYYPDAVRYFDFVYDRVYKYTVALISYVADGHTSWSRFEIFDTDGTLKDTVDCTYLAADFNELADRQLNDVMYISHNDYPTAKLVRLADTEWELSNAPMTGGPWLPWNADDITVYVEKTVYSSTATYMTGDVIHSGVSDVSVTAAAYIFWKNVSYKDYFKSLWLVRLTIGSHSIPVNGVVKVSGFSGEAYILNGVFTVLRVGSTYIEINAGTWGYIGTMYNYPTLPTSFTTEKVGNNGGDQFFVSLVDNNVGRALPVAPAIETAYWRKTSLIESITLKSTDDLFTANHIGQKIYAAVNIAQTYSGVFDAVNENSDPVAYSNGAVTLRTEGGVWGGILALQQSVDGGVTWDTIGVINGGGGNHNGEITRDIQEPLVTLRVLMQTYESVTNGTNCKWQLEFPQGTPFIAEITAFTDARTVTVALETALTQLFQTKNWKFGAFSEANGYPGVVAIHDERLMLGGSKLQPFMVWGSTVNNWEWFADGVLETSPVAIQANADRATRLCWLASKGELLFGTDFNEYSAGSRDSDKIISGVNPPKIQVQNSYSSAPIQALLIGEDIIFVQSDKKTLRSIAFSDAKWGYAGVNLTVSCPDIAGSGFRWLSVQKNPFPVIWAGTEDDTLISFTYDKEMNIMGWARHPFAGATVVSGCVIPGAGDDMLIICTKRGTKFQMERLSYSNSVFTDDAGGSDAVMTSLIQPTSLAQSPNVLEEVRYRITKVFLYLKASQGGEVSVDDGESWTAIEYPSNALFTGKVEVNVNSGTTEKAPLMIRTTGTQAFNLLAIGLDIDRQSTKE
jgi:hypothetical protein